MTRTPRGEPDLPPGPARDLVDLFRLLRHVTRSTSRKSNRQIALRAGLSASHLSEVLSGWKAPSPEAAGRIATALNANDDDVRRAQVLAERLADLNRYHRRKLTNHRTIEVGEADDHRDVSHRDFRIGPLRVPCRIIEGDGEHPIEHSRVRVLVNPVDVQLPDQVAQWRAEIEAEQARRREVGEDWSWGGPRYAVEDLVIERDGPDEYPAVTLILKHSDYYTFMATQLLDRRLPGGTTLRSLYLDGRDPRDVPDFMRSSLGLNIALITADNWLVVSHRSQRIGVGRGLWNSSANEGLSRSKDAANGGPPDLFQAAQRGVREELQLAPDQYQLSLLAFSVVTSMSQWAALFQARLDAMTRRDFEDSASRGIEDGWEHPEFDYVRFTPTAVLRYVLRDDRRDNWAPTAPVLFYLSLVHTYGRRAVDHVLRQLSGATTPFR